MSDPAVGTANITAAPSALSATKTTSKAIDFGSAGQNSADVAALTAKPMHDLFASPVLVDTQRDQPAIHNTPRSNEAAMQQLHARYQRKEAELRQCLQVGTALLSQLDTLKERCERLAQDRDDAVAAAAREVKSAQVAHESECARYRNETEKALQEAAAALVRAQDAELALTRSDAELREVKRRTEHVLLKRAEDDTVNHHLHQQETERLRSTFEKQLAEAREVGDIEKESLVMEATIELERLQHAYVRARRELVEQQQSSARAQARQEELLEKAAVEKENLQRRIRQLEEAQQERSRQLQHAEKEAQSTSSSNHQPAPLQLRVAGGGTSRKADELTPETATLPHQCLLDENARLRHRLQEETSRAQDEIDRVHAERLEVQQQLQATQAQAHLLRTEVVAGLQGEVESAAAQLEAANARGAALQNHVLQLTARLGALERDKEALSEAAEAQQAVIERVTRELKETRDQKDALAHTLEAAVDAAKKKDETAVRLQRETQRLSTALRTLQGKTTDIESALAGLSAEHSESASAFKVSEARLQERCVSLQQEADDLRTARDTLMGRLRDAEEALDVLTNAQRLSQEYAREAQRKVKEADDQVAAATAQSAEQQALGQVRLARAQQQVERVQVELRTETQRSERTKQELVRAKAELRSSADAQAKAAEEVRRLRKELETCEGAARERFREQNVQNTREWEALVSRKESELEHLRLQVQEQRTQIVEMEGRAEQRLTQEQQLEATLADALAAVATNQGRITALQDELARVQKEQNASLGILLHKGEASDRGAHEGLSLTAVSTGQDRQHPQRLLANVAAAVLRRDDGTDLWNSLLDTLMQAEKDLASGNPSQMLLAEEEGEGDGQRSRCEETGVTHQRPTASPFLSSFYASHAAAVDTLRAIRRAVSSVHVEEERRWTCARNAVHEAVSIGAMGDELIAAQSAAPLMPTAALLDPVRGGLGAAVGYWVEALKGLRVQFARNAAQLEKMTQLSGHQAARLEYMEATLQQTQEHVDQLKKSLDDATVKGRSAASAAAVAEARVHAMQLELTTCNAHASELERRLHAEIAEREKERAEWKAKGEQVGAERQRRGAELELEALRAAAASREARLQRQLELLEHEKESYAQMLRQVKGAAVELQGKATIMEEIVTTKEEELAQAAQTVQELRGALQQHRANNAAADAVKSCALAEQVSALQLQLETCQQEAQLRERVYTAEVAELEALRKVNDSLETRLVEVEKERAPLREQLHRLLTFPERPG